MMQSRSSTLQHSHVAPHPTTYGGLLPRTHRRVQTQATPCGHGPFHSSTAGADSVSLQGCLPAPTPTPQVLPGGARKHICRAVKTHRKSLQRQLMCVSSDVDTQPVVDQLLEELRLVVEAQRLKEGSPTLPRLPTLREPQQTRLKSLNNIVERLPPPPQDLAPQTFPLAGTVQVCQGRKCQSQGAQAVLEAALAITSGNETVEVMPCKCLGKCKQAVAMRVRTEQTEGRGHTHTAVTPDQVSDILGMHFVPALPTAHLEPSGVNSAMA